MASPSVTKPTFRRSKTIEYDVSELCPPLKKISEMTIQPSDSVGTSLASKSFRSALGTTAYEKAMSDLGHLRLGDDAGTNTQESNGTGTYRAMDLTTMVDSISDAIMDKEEGYGSVGVYRHHCTDVSFEANGCQWEATVVPTKIEGGDEEERQYLEQAREAGIEKFQIRIVCFAVDPAEDATASADLPPDDKKTTYAVKMDLLDPDTDDLASPKTVAHHRIRKDRVALITKIFDEIGLDIKKALVRCEFPEFPEGRKGRPFREVYQLNARLKSGSFATVCRGTHRASGEKVAIKCVLRKDLPPSDDAAIYDEVAILASIRHPFVVPLIDFFEEKECYFLVMELMAGGDLFDRIGKKKSYSEADARDLCRKMLEAVKHLHDNSIAHCDMKPKNLLLKSEDDDSYIKLADFGFATRVYGPNSLTKQCGTPFFVAPEILMRVPYDQAADMWSVGVIIYLLLGGNLPFMGRSQRELFRAIVVGKYDFPEDSWGLVSENAKTVIKGLLVTDPANRWTAAQVMRSAWLRDDAKRLSRNNLMYTSQKLKTFNARMKLRSAMIAVDWVSKTSIWKSSRSSMTSQSSATDGEGISESGHASRIEEGDEEEEEETPKK